MRTCGIDVGHGIAFPVVLDLARRRLLMPPRGLSPASAVKWVRSESPISIAIDSPSRPNRRLLADPAYRDRYGIDLRYGGADRRVCEWRLGIGGCYSTRSLRAACQPWMQTGMDVFCSFARQGYQLDRGAGGDLFEIHPTYGFRSLLGHTSEGLRVRCRRLLPKKRPGSPGHEQRLTLLALLLRRWRIPLPGCAARSLDWTDAILGSALAALRSDGHTFLVDAPGAEEGAIVLAAMPATFQRWARKRVSGTSVSGKQAS